MKWLFLLSICCCFSASGFGQGLLSGAEEDTVSGGFFPVLGYHSDLGFIGGGFYARYDYRGDAQPFRSYFQAEAAFSTKGLVILETRYEHTRSFNVELRSSLESYLNRFKTDYYFGIGNNTAFSEDLWEGEYYYFESIKAGVEYEARKRAVRLNEAYLDATAGLEIGYFIPYSTGNDTKFEEDRPPGEEGGWINGITAGLIWENRDSEFDPGRGNRASLKLGYVPSFLLSSFEFGYAELDLRQYFSISDRITFATRIYGRHTMGTVPFWELSMLGDSDFLRGYPLNRFLGRSAVAVNLEVRTWVFNIPRYGIKLGGQLFTDLGRVFSEQDDSKHFFSDYKQTFGIGGAMSVFSPDFILRGDLGFSEELVRLYVGIGYVF